MAEGHHELDLTKLFGNYHWKPLLIAPSVLLITEHLTSSSPSLSVGAFIQSESFSILHSQHGYTVENKFFGFLSQILISHTRGKPFSTVQHSETTEPSAGRVTCKCGKCVPLNKWTCCLHVGLKGLQRWTTLDHFDFNGAIHIDKLSKSSIYPNISVHT